MKSSGRAARPLALSDLEDTNVDGVHPGSRILMGLRIEMISQSTYLPWNPLN